MKYTVLAILEQAKNMKARVFGVFAPIAPTPKLIAPANANCVVPSVADAVPECSLKRAIAKVTEFGAINPSVAIAQNNDISKIIKLFIKLAQSKTTLKALIKANPVPKRTLGSRFKTSLAFTMLVIIKPKEFTPKSAA